MMKKVMLIVGCLGVFAMVVNADTIILQDYKDGNTGHMAVSIGGQNAGEMIANFGKVGQGQIGSAGPTVDVKALLYFDVSALAGATINGATVFMYGRDSGYLKDPVGGIDIHALLPANAGWIEGTGDMIAPAYVGWPALPGEVTWGEHGYQTQNWAGSAGAGTLGTDISAAPIGNLPWVGNGTAGGGYMFEGIGGLKAEITASVVQGWVDNAANNAGLLLKNHTLDDVQSFFCSNEWGGEAYHGYEPGLIIDYTPVPEPMTMVLLGLGGLLIRRRK